MKDLSRKVAMHCPICGGTLFSTLNESIECSDLVKQTGDIEMLCAGCSNIITKDELIKANESVINDNIDDIKNEAIDEIGRELKRILKNTSRR